MSLTLFVAVGSESQASIINGSFELPVVNDMTAAGSGRQTFGVGSTDITGWVISGVGDVYLHKSPQIGTAIGAEFNFAQAGNQYLDLSGGIGGGVSGLHATISQSVPTIIGESYLLEFYIGAARSPSASINVKLAGAASLLNQTLTASAPNTNIVWTKQSFPFIADSLTTTLSFVDTSTFDDNYSFVDNVSITRVVPEPSSLLYCGGLALCGAAIRRRK
ncbi:MAG TPA: DUF642 domain-containing protein [Lacipirellulaceae bacterium]|nr:DUF642 domain-containing protein [Lacipirellulaceae bacterium]